MNTRNAARSAKGLYALMAAVLLTCSMPAMAGVQIILFIPGVEGDSIVDDYDKQIDVLGWSWGTSNAASGPGKNFSCNIQDISIVKFVDRASPILLMDQLQGKVYEEAILTVARSSSGGSLQEFIVIKLKYVRVTSLSVSAFTGQEVLTENITLNFTEATYTYIPQGGGGGPGPGQPVVAEMLGC